MRLYGETMKDDIYINPDMRYDIDGVGSIKGITIMQLIIRHAE